MKRPVYFIGHPLHTESGSTILRSNQLCDIARNFKAFSGVELAVLFDSDRSNSVLIFNKNALEKCAQADIARLKRQGNFMIADPLDGRFDNELLSTFDCVIAASILQFEDYKTRYFGRAAYVGHHVDLRIGPVSVKTDRFSLGYFGEPGHARYVEELRHRFTLNAIDTSKAYDTRWMSRLDNHNAHYAIRSVDPATGFKPFTKGFIAAHCGAPILAADHDLEARHFLPASYPYFTATDAPQSVLSTIDRMANAFLTRDWTLALNAMDALRDACSPVAIARQIYAAVSAAF